MKLIIRNSSLVFVVILILVGFKLYNSPTLKGTRVLPVEEADLSIRFQHIKPLYDEPHLVAYWSMDEGSGYEFQDNSSNSNIAYIHGETWNTEDSGLTASFRHSGRRGGGVYLNENQWLQVQNHSSLDLTEGFTINAWIKPYGRNSEEVTLIRKSDDNHGFDLKLNQNGALCLWLDNNASGYSTCTEDLRLSDNEWHFLSVVYRPGVFQYYVDGALKGAFENDKLLFSNASSDLMIGGTDGKLGFKGWIDEVSLYNRELGEKEIQSAYIVGFPKIYTQTRETIDAHKSVWNHYKGNQLIPHPIDEQTLFSATFDETLTTSEGYKPKEHKTNANLFAPGHFGGAFNAVLNQSGLTFDSPMSTTEGSLGIWFIPETVNSKENYLFQANGKKKRKKSALSVFYEQNKWKAIVEQNSKTYLLESEKMDFAAGLMHLGLSWKDETVKLFINGVEVAAKKVPELISWNETIHIGGSGEKRANGYIDDINISTAAKDWFTICPTGHIDTESASLDFRDGFNHNSDEQVFLWASLDKNETWHYTAKAWEAEEINTTDLRRALYQSSDNGLKAIYHPAAYGHMSSIEAGISFDEVKDGWAGVFVKSPEKNNDFEGLTFMINPGLNQMRLAVITSGVPTRSKILPYDFTLKDKTTYTLTLSAVNGVIRGYIDGNNLISMNELSEFDRGYAGLITQKTTAYFDDVHFTAVTPSVQDSRKIAQRVIFSPNNNSSSPEIEDMALSAFRWKKRYGILPWQRNYKEPEPPGNIFGPATDIVSRPNPSAFWRSEDAANSDILMVDSKMYYFMRGNPDFNGPHGVAAIGVLESEAENFDGIHFKDLSSGIEELDNAQLLRGHKDNSYCPDVPPRNDRFQINDAGSIYIEGKIILLAREFKNPFSAFRRLVYGVYDLEKQHWEQQEPYTVEWSQMNPDSCYAKITGLNATPEVTMLRDPENDHYTIFLYHSGKDRNGVSAAMISGLVFQEGKLILDPLHPEKVGFTKQDQDAVYGERILFDNGIYYMHVNAGSDKSKLKKDWPDRFQLFTSLHPYESSWSESKVTKEQPDLYFTRGGEFDPDNAAIWQGTMFKHKNRYYMYYENYHSIENIDNPYDLYDAMHSGSRVGYCTGN